MPIAASFARESHLCLLLLLLLPIFISASSVPINLLVRILCFSSASPTSDGHSQLHFELCLTRRPDTTSFCPAETPSFVLPGAGRLGACATAAGPSPPDPIRVALPNASWSPATGLGGLFLQVRVVHTWSSGIEERRDTVVRRAFNVSGRSLSAVAFAPLLPVPAESAAQAAELSLEGALERPGRQITTVGTSAATTAMTATATTAWLPMGTKPEEGRTEEGKRGTAWVAALVVVPLVLIPGAVGLVLWRRRREQKGEEGQRRRQAPSRPLSAVAMDHMTIGNNTYLMDPTYSEDVYDEPGAVYSV